MTGVIAVLPLLRPINERGMVFNDPGVALLDFINPIGRRAVSAYNVPVVLDESLGYRGVWNGFDQGIRSTYLSAYDLLQEIKAGGVGARVELENQ